MQMPRGGHKPGSEFSAEAPGWSEPARRRPPWCQEKGRGRHWKIWGLGRALAFFGMCQAEKRTPPQNGNACGACEVTFPRISNPSPVERSFMV